MAKVKFTKGELKRQRDSLRQYQRYLPTLQLKKQQFQLEILRQVNILEERKHTYQLKRKSAETWTGLLQEAPADLAKWLQVEQVVSSARNIAGVDIPIFDSVMFTTCEYDLFVVPPWVDTGLDALKQLISLLEEIKVIERGISILRSELRITNQRVNLFEKVKIPEAEETIRQIKIYIGDQMTNAVGRSKIAKAKIEANNFEEVLV